MSDVKASIRELEYRAEVYRLLSAAFREPSPAPLERGPLRELFSRLPEGVGLALPPEAPADLPAEFRRVFGHNLSPDCPPYETQYGKSDVFRQTHAMADLNGFYSAFGLAVGEGDRRADHLPVELEFAAILCLKEVLALERGEEEKSTICRDARLNFLGDHLGRWVPGFADAVKKKIPEGYHAGVTDTLASFIRWDARSLGLDIDAPRPAEVRREEPEDPCSSCFGGINESA